MSYVFSISWFYNTVLVHLGTFLQYLISFGEVDTVVLDYLLSGNSFTWEALNIFTGESSIITVHSYEYLISLLQDAVNSLPGGELTLVSNLLSFLNSGLSALGHSLYVLIFGLPVSTPLWVSLILVYPRFVFLTFAFDLIKKFITDVF